MSQFPQSITLEGVVLEDIIAASDFFKVLDRWEGHKKSYTLTAEKLFDNDQYMWRMFVDLFFPEKIPELPKMNNGTFRLTRAFMWGPGELFGLNESMYPLEDVHALFDFLMIDRQDWDAVMRYLEDVHYVHQKRPPPPPTYQQSKYVRQYNPNLSLTPRYNENNFASNNESEPENEVELGFKNEEEEEAYGKLKPANQKRYGYQGGKRKTRKLKRRH